MTAYECYCLYNALKLHFTTDNYDFFKYNGKSKTNIDAFENRKDKYYFYKLSRRFAHDEDLKMFIVANFVENSGVWIGNMLDPESDTIYRSHYKILQAFTYNFTEDCNKLFQNRADPNEVLVVKDDFPLLMKWASRKEVSIETVCALNCILNFIPKWNKQIKDTIVWPNFRRKILKYQPFLNIDKSNFAKILMGAINDN